MKQLGLFMATVTEKNASIQTENLFVLYDTGETEFLAPVMHCLEKTGKDYRVLVMGTAAEVILQKKLPSNKIIFLASLGLEKKIDKTTSRFEELSQSELQMIHSGLKTHNLVVGFASMVQKQLATEYSQDSHTFMVWDNFVAPGPEEGEAFKVAHQIQHVVEKVLYPSNYVANHMVDRPSNFEVVGHPSLEPFCEEFSQINPIVVREKLNLPQDQTVYAYLGGWGEDPDYQKGFELFAKCLQDNPFNKALFMIQPHPKSAEATFERDVLQRYGITNFFIAPPKTVNTSEVVAISSGPVFCHKSTVGVKVAALGKEIVHVLNPEDAYTNALLQANVSPRIDSAKDLQKLVADGQTLKKKSDLYSIMMMPKNAIDRVCAELEKTFETTHSIVL